MFAAHIGYPPPAIPRSNALRGPPPTSRHMPTAADQTLREPPILRNGCPRAYWHQTTNCSCCQQIASASSTFSIYMTPRTSAPNIQAPAVRLVTGITTYRSNPPGPCLDHGSIHSGYTFHTVRSPPQTPPSPTSVGTNHYIIEVCTLTHPNSRTFASSHTRVSESEARAASQVY